MAAYKVPDVFQAYDIRGKYPEELNEEFAYRLGRSTAKALDVRSVLIGRDMRHGSGELFVGLSQGFRDEGVNVCEIGFVSTDVVYFCLGHYIEYDLGVMITASHNPKEYNGFKMVRRGVVPVGPRSGLSAIEQAMQETPGPASPNKGRITYRDVLADYIPKVLDFARGERFQNLTVVVDPSNGVGGKIFRELAASLRCKLIEINAQADAEFPAHSPNPLHEEALNDIKAAVKEYKADVGVVFDGDADRAILVDENGEVVTGSQLVALLADAFLEEEPNARVIYNLVTSRAVPDVVRAKGGIPYISPVGHSHVKYTMKYVKGLLAGEHSGHYYFRDFFSADSAMVGTVATLYHLARSERPMSELVQPHRRYVMCEKSRKIAHRSEAQSIIGRAEHRLFQQFSRPTGVSRIQGVKVDYPDWWFCLRASGSEPLLRVTVEAQGEEVLRERLEVILNALDESIKEA